jgi:predicted ribosome quality control (RQC) complex YloA/Tae2 family protein
MQVDFLTLACFFDHMDRLLGARVQQVLLPNGISVGLELYAGQRYYLLASARSQAPRILLLPERPRRGVETETPMLLLLRKWVRGARLVNITQPAWERILIFHFSSRVDKCQLIVELMGRHSNVILVGPDGSVLESVKHVGPRISRTRTMLPGQPYKTPPLPPNRVPPVGLTAAEWTARLAQAPLEEVLHRWLVGHFFGVSPIVAREVAVRATGHAEALVGDAKPEEVQGAVNALFAPLQNGWWKPHVALDETGRVTAFTPYEPQQFERVEPAPDISQAMCRYFDAQGMADPYAAARQAVQKVIAEVRERLAKRLERLQQQVITDGELDDLRIAGELLLTYQGQVPGGASTVTLPGYTGDTRTIALDPKKSPVENAQAYFRRYEKAHRAADQVPKLIEDLKAERAYLEQLDADLMLAESRPEIDAVRYALADAGWTRKVRQKTSVVGGPLRIELGGFPVYVGRNARQNDQVTFRRAGPEDLWLHVRGLPGAHVIIRSGGQHVPDDVIQRAAEIAAHYSRARDSETQVSVDITERRFVRRLRGRFPGLVTYRNERTIRVRVGAVDPATLDSST